MALGTGTQLPGWKVLEKVNPAGAVVAHRTPKLTYVIQFCVVDGLPLHSHPRCRSCMIMVGPGHVCESTTGGLCESCRRVIVRRQLRKLKQQKGEAP